MCVCESMYNLNKDLVDSESKGQQHAADPDAPWCSTGDLDVSTKQNLQDDLASAEVSGYTAQLQHLCGVECNGAIEATVLNSCTGHSGVAGPRQTVTCARTPRTLLPIDKSTRSGQCLQVAVVSIAANLSVGFPCITFVHRPFSLSVARGDAGQQR